MRCVFLLFLVFNLSVLAYTQNGKNPFKLSTPTKEKVTSAPKEEQVATNPFDLHKVPKKEQAKSKVNKSNNPFDLSSKTKPATTEANKVIVATKKTDIEPLSAAENDPSAKVNGWILSFTLIILTLTTFVFIFFRSLYYKIYKAIFNDNQLSLLYRERQGGSFGNFFIAYGLFFISMAFFIYLSLVHFGFLSQGNIVKNYTRIIAALTGVFIAKHLLLALLAYIFPISKEVRVYSFSIMIFAIIIGLVIAIVDFVLAYSPEGLKTYIIYFIGLFLLLFYLLRSLRALFIANHFVFNYLFHFLLYLCAVEIAPALIIYKMILNIQG